MNRFFSAMALYGLLAPFCVSTSWAAHAGHDAGGHHHAHEAASGGLPQFNPEFYASQAFWVLLIFVLLYVFFSKSILPVLSSTIENRRAQLDGDLENARAMKEEAERVRKAYEKALAEARSRAQMILSDNERAIKARVSESLSALQEKSLKEMERTQASLTEAKAEAMKDIEGIAAQAATQAAHKIAGLSADAELVQSVVKTIKEAA